MSSTADSRISYCNENNHKLRKRNRLCSTRLNINPRKQKLIVYVVLTVVTLAVFWQVNQFDFINFDDVVYVTENSHIQSGITLDGFRWAFSTRYFDLWHPLIWLSFMFDYQLWPECRRLSSDQSYPAYIELFIAVLAF